MSKNIQSNKINKIKITKKIYNQGMKLIFLIIIIKNKLQLLKIKVKLKLLKLIVLNLKKSKII